IAWLHHKGINKHHYEHWQDNFDSGTTHLVMPFKYALELICDNLGAGNAYLGDKFTLQGELDWWKNRNKNGHIAMADATWHFVDCMFKTLAKKFVGKISKASIIEIVPTKKVLDLASKYYMRGDIRGIPTGILLDRFYSSNCSEKESKELKKTLGIPEQQFVFGYIGRTSPEKNIITIIDAYAKLQYKENSVLLIVGGGPQLEELKEYVKQLGIENKVIFTGFIDNELIPVYYHICDIFVNASKSETQGLTYIESLASSLPVLVQKDECIEEVVQNYYNGIYFDGEEDLILKMEEIQKAPTTLKNIKANTRKSCRKYSKAHYASSVEKVYKEAIELFKKIR
ncbi:MAG TPA: DUF5662 family protein, partial [Candidatus Pelethenecus sp.]|nr:DUF5662 family protein [Candidatus Pelethenecus sp.]